MESGVLSRGWSIGTPGLPAAEAAVLREEAWENAVVKALRAARRTEDDLWNARKTAAWKITLAAQVRNQTGASIVWLARRLHLGTADAARNQLSIANRKDKSR